MRTVIAGQVDQTVILGQSGYGNGVTVASSGSIVPAYDAAANRYYGGIYVPASVINARVTNHGYIGATNGYGYGAGGNGGVGVHFATSGHLTNTGSIIGGGGGFGDDVGGTGGDGVFFGGAGVLANSGLISGGVGGYSANAGAGGNGIDLLGAGRLSNTGTISGGASGSSSYQFYDAGTGVNLLQGGTLTNDGTVTGGAGGSAYSTYKTAMGGMGGVGVNVAAGSHLFNDGLILAGAGGGSMVTGGNGAGGVYATGGSVVSNSGTVVGGAGASVSSSYAVLGGRGGLGVSVAGGSRLTNDGVILGGAGGSSPKYGGGGGDGVDVAGGGMVTNLGTITGGAGGAGDSHQFGPGYGGNGVFLDGGTLVNAGVIVSGANGAGGPTAYGADAVRFGQATSTLVVDPGAVFTGRIAGYRLADDTLRLAGTSPGSLSGFGTSITDLTTIREDAHANWALGGSITGTGSVQIGADATLTLRGAVAVPTIAFLGGGGETLRLGTPAHVTSMLQGFSSGDVIDVEKVHATSLAYENGTLTLYDGQSVVDTLTLLGHYTQADFSLTTDGHTGTDVVFASQPSADLHLSFFDRIIAYIPGHVPL